jgi:branched-chain amino acid transport system substrate-binding protein
MLFPTSLTPTKAFSEYYHETYGRDVEIGADSAYDAVMLIAEAMKETGSFDPERVAKYLASVHTYEGVSGTLIADGKRGFTKDYVLIESRDGKPIPVP